MNWPVILFIDQNQEDREFYIQRLQSSIPGVRVINAATGQTGLTLYEQQRVDCVLLELDLPDTSAMEVLVKLVPRVEHPEVAVIVLTRIPSEYIWDTAKRNGAQAVLYKPMTSGDILYKAIFKAIAKVAKDQKRPRT